MRSDEIARGIQLANLGVDRQKAIRTQMAMDFAKEMLCGMPYSDAECGDQFEEDCERVIDVSVKLADRMMKALGL